MNSGGGVHKSMNSNATTKDRFEFWEKVMEDAGCKNVAELRALDADKLFTSFMKLMKSSPKYGMVASPCIDGLALTMSGLDAANQGIQKLCQAHYYG